MDWFRKMFGFRDNRPRPPENYPDDFQGGGSFSYGGDGYHDSFSMEFGQIDDMFHQLDSIMQRFHGFHGHPGQVFISEEPDAENPTNSQPPRDSLLKTPDSQTPDGSYPQHTLPHRRSPFYGPAISDHEDDGNDHFGLGHGGRFGGFREFGMADPFQMMEDIFKSFGRMPFDWNPGTPMLPDPEDNPRNSVLKSDSDLDDRITGGFSDLLKDMPGYNPPNVQGQPSITTPKGYKPQVQQKYQSTSIVRIRKPDGSIEETRKYTDNTGREEMTVTHVQPEDGHKPGSLLRQDQDVFDGRSGAPHNFSPSLFSWIFTR
ncbi:hypothetical protein SK128_021690 [Halocaridina rubra]|uniref:HCLS1-associated protein X-1 n=1 Tax=Halocaridina rubra TaxID=373956 RepID=A0AAN8ZXI6_HALRR